MFGKTKINFIFVCLFYVGKAILKDFIINNTFGLCQKFQKEASKCQLHL